MQRSILPVIAFILVILAMRSGCTEEKLTDNKKVFYSSDSLAVTEQFLLIRNNDTIDSSATHYFTDKTHTRMNAVYIVKRQNGKNIFRKEIQYDSAGEKINE